MTSFSNGVPLCGTKPATGQIGDTGRSVAIGMAAVMVAKAGTRSAATLALADASIAMVVGPGQRAIDTRRARVGAQIDSAWPTASPLRQKSQQVLTPLFGA